MNARRILLLNTFKLFDLLVMVAAFIAAAFAVLHLNHTITVTRFFSIRIKIEHFLIFAVFIFSWHLILHLSGLYESRRLSQGRDELFDLVRATSLGTLVVFLGTVVFHIHLTTPFFLLVFWLASTCTLVSSRVLLRGLLAAVRKRGRNLRNIIIVGTSNRALEFARRLDSRLELGYRIIGFVDQDWAGLESLQRSGYTLASDFSG